MVSQDPWAYAESMNAANPSEPTVPGLKLNVSAADAAKLVGKWLVVDEAGNVKVTGTDFAEAHRLAVAAGLDFERVEFVCLPPLGFVG